MALRDQLRVLVVDDMSTSRNLMEQALETLGVRHVRIAADGRSALDMALCQPVHLVISDQYMPDIDGLQLLSHLRRMPETQGVGFLLVTGRADAGLVARGRELGLNNLMTKPYDPGQLKVAIEAIVGRL